MTSDEFREIALRFPEALEGSHMNHPDFRVGGKVFASLAPDLSWGMAKLKPDQQQHFLRTEPDIFFPASGKWGDRGATNIALEHAHEDTVHQALAAAWRNTAPAKLIRERSDIA